MGERREGNDKKGGERKKNDREVNGKAPKRAKSYVEEDKVDTER